MRKERNGRKVKRRWAAGRKDEKGRMTPVQLIGEADISHGSRRDWDEAKTMCKQKV